jgi:hypothetical protein
MKAPPEYAMTPTSPRRRVFAALALAGLLALSGCGRDPSGEAPRAAQAPEDASAQAGPADEAFERTWLGVLPCADCDGIQTRLQLREDADGPRYVLEETYLGGAGENRFFQEGPWREENAVIDGVDTVVYRLDPDGPGRWFWPQPDGGLEMLEGEGRPAADGLAYRLQRL